MAASDYHTFQVKVNKDKKWIDYQYYQPYGNFEPIGVAEDYAMNEGLEDGDIVHVKNYGSFKIDVYMEPEYHARKTK